MRESGANQTFASISEDGMDMAAIDSGKPSKEVVHARPFVQIFKQRPHWNSRSFKHPSPADTFGRFLNGWTSIPIEHEKI